MELLSPSHGKFIYKEEEVINFEKNIWLNCLKIKSIIVIEEIKKCIK